MADLNKISEIGRVEADLDGDAATRERLNERAFSRAELDEHASNLDVNDKGLFDAIAAARTQVDLFLASNPGEAEIRSLINYIETAIGGPFDSEEGIWLAEQLGIADELGLDQNGAVVEAAPAAESEISPERQAELAAVLDAYVAEAREAFTAAGVSMPPEIETALNNIRQRLGEPATAEVVALAEALRPNLDWMNSQPDVLAAVMANPNFINSLTGGQFAAVDGMLTGLEAALNGVTVEADRTRIISERLGSLPTAPASTTEAVLNGPLEALLNSVPESMRTMFATEYAAWEADLRGGGERISFNDYLIQQANGDQGRLQTIALKMQLSSIIEMLKPFFDAIRSLTRQANPEADEETETPAQQRALRIRAAQNGVTPEVQRQNERRLAAFETLFNTANAPVISDFYNMEATPPAFDADVARSFLAKPAHVDLDRAAVETTVKNVKGVLNDQQESVILTKGLSLQELNAIAGLPRDAIGAVTPAGIEIGGTVVVFGGNFSENLNSAIGAFNRERERVAAEFTRIRSLFAEGKLSTDIASSSDFPAGYEGLFNAGKTELIPAFSSFLKVTKEPLTAADLAILIERIDDFQDYSFQREVTYLNSFGGYIDETAGDNNSWDGFEGNEATAFAVDRPGLNYAFKNQSIFLNWLNNQ